MDKNSCYAAVEQGERGMYTSKARATGRHANTPKAKKANRDIFYSSCGPSPMRDWLDTRMLVNQPCCGKFQRRGRRSPPIRLRRFTRSWASLNFRVIDAPWSRTFPV